MQDGLWVFWSSIHLFYFLVRMAVTEVKREPVNHEITTVDELIKAPSSKVSIYIAITLALLWYKCSVAEEAANDNLSLFLSGPTPSPNTPPPGWPVHVPGVWLWNRRGPTPVVRRLWRQLSHLLSDSSPARRPQRGLEVPQVPRSG